MIETHLVVLFDNQLDRTIKIIPSRSSKGSYAIEPRGYMQVNITVDSQDPFQDIHFKAVDREMQIPVLLNNTMVVSLKPSDDKDFVNRITLTPPGKGRNNLKPSFDSI